VSALYPAGPAGLFHAALDQHGAGNARKILVRPYRKMRAVEEMLGVAIAGWEEAEWGWLRVYLRGTVASRSCRQLRREHRS
jgi:hypothetical protein